MRISSLARLVGKLLGRQRRAFFGKRPDVCKADVSLPRAGSRLAA